MATMRGAVLTAPYDMRIEEMPRPEVDGDDIVILKNEGLGICGSNLHWWNGGGSATRLLQFPMIGGGGHEYSGVVADVGGNIGYYSLWFATLGVRMGRVYTFEPAPEPLRLLKENMRLNDVGNVDIIECACGDHVGNVEFFIANHHHSSSLIAEWAGNQAHTISVSMTTLDVFFAAESGRKAPAFIKIDIEGGGVFALPGCRRILSENRPFVLIESHTPNEDGAISKVLIDLAYRGYRLNNREWVRKPQATHPDQEGVWGTLLLVPQELEERISPRLMSAS